MRNRDASYFAESLMKFSNKDVYDRLKTVIDPELNVNIVDLGLIYDVSTKIQDSILTIQIRMTLTSPGCPLAPLIDRMVRDCLREVVVDVDKNVEVVVVFDPPWTVEMMSEEVKIELGLDE